jgi:hypothetical protein
MDFNTQLYSSPKIDIIGKEVPLAAMEKTGDILQGRYDAAKDTETKTMALTKKLASSSNAADRETANKIMEFYGNKMKERTEAGDYQNMKWQTQQDAMDAAGLYEGLANRNKELMKYAEDIDTKSGITDVNRRAYEKNKWLQSQSKTMFNPESGVLENVGVVAPSLYKDVDMAKFTDQFGQGIIADIVGNTTKGEKVFQKGETLPNGQVAPGITVYDVASGRQRSVVTPDRVRKVVEGYAKGSPEVAAYLNGVEDYYENKLGMSKQEAQNQAYNNVIEKAVQPAIAKYAHSSDISSSDQGINLQATGYFNAGNGNNNEKLPFGEFDPIPSSNIPSAIKSSVSSFAQKAREAGAFSNNESAVKFQNSKNNKTMLYSFASNLIENMDKIKKTNPKLYNSLSDPNLDLSKNPLGINLKKEDYVTPIQAIMKLKKGETLNSAEMSIVNNLMQNENIPMTSNFSYVSTSDPNFKNTIEREYGDEVKTGGQYDTEKAKQALDQKYFGDKNGLTVEKDKPLVLGTAQNYNILDPLTGHIIPAADFFKKEQNNLSSGQSLHTEIVGHPDPSTLQMANNKNEYAQENGGAQYFGDGVVINVNGRQVIMANPGQEHQNTPNAIIANYSQYLTGWNPEEKIMWGTDANNKPIIKTISTTDKYVTLDGKKMTKDEFKFRVWELAQGKTK